jgi:hypothetical protein
MTTTAPGLQRGFLFAVLAAPAIALAIFFASLFAGVGEVGAVVGVCACPIAAFAGAKGHAIATGQALLRAGIALLALIAALSLLAIAMAFAYGHFMAGFN